MKILLKLKNSVILERQGLEQSRRQPNSKRCQSMSAQVTEEILGS
jgi:hypothetical protein